MTMDVAFIALFKERVPRLTAEDEEREEGGGRLDKSGGQRKKDDDEREGRKEDREGEEGEWEMEDGKRRTRSDFQVATDDQSGCIESDVLSNRDGEITRD